MDKTDKNSKKKVAIIELGAGTTISTVQFESELIAKNNHNAKLIRINPRDFQVPQDLGYSVALGAVDGLTQILK